MGKQKKLTKFMYKKKKEEEESKTKCGVKRAKYSSINRKWIPNTARLAVYPIEYKLFQFEVSEYMLRQPSDILYSFSID